MIDTTPQTSPKESRFSMLATQVGERLARRNIFASAPTRHTDGLIQIAPLKKTTLSPVQVKANHRRGAVVMNVGSGTVRSRSFDMKTEMGDLADLAKQVFLAPTREQRAALLASAGR